MMIKDKQMKKNIPTSFRVTTILCRKKLNEANMRVGSIINCAEGTSNYLKLIGLDFSKHKVFRIKKPTQYLINNDYKNNLIVNYKEWDALVNHANEKAPIHVLIERIQNTI